jgi:hypothetical protein
MTVALSPGHCRDLPVFLIPIIVQRGRARVLYINISGCYAVCQSNTCLTSDNHKD